MKALILKGILAAALLLTLQSFYVWDSCAYLEPVSDHDISVDEQYVPAPPYDVSVVEVTGVPQSLKVKWLVPPLNRQSSGVAIADARLLRSLSQAGAQVRVLGLYDERDHYYLVAGSSLVSENALAGICRVIWKNAGDYLVSSSRRIEDGLAFLRARASHLIPYETSLASAGADAEPFPPPPVHSPMESSWIRQMVSAVSEPDLLNHVCILSGETPLELPTGPYTLMTRYVNHPDCLKAAEYLYSLFESWGLDVAYDPFLGLTIRCVEFVDTEGYAVGELGTIHHTTDGGDTWEKQDSGTAMDLWKACFVSPDTGWVVGTAGTLLKTTNGGSEWTTIETGIGPSMFGIDFFDSNLGWMCGGGGVIARSTDGGSNWTVQHTGGASLLYDVEFTDSLNGWAVGTNGTILRSSDGGRTWGSQQSGIEERLYDACFVDSLNGWAVGLRGTVIRTSDGGAHWELQIVPEVETLYSVCFVDSLNGWAAGREGLLLFTRDGGLLWRAQRTGTQMELNSVDFVNPLQGWIAGVHTLSRTVDGGSSWMSLGTRLPESWRNVVATLKGTENPSEIYIVCGHYDSLSDIPMVRAPGADDNASGTSLVLEAARILSDYEFESTIRFVCLTGEELGLYGSEHHARTASSVGEDIRAVLNFDMVAWGDPAIFLIANQPSSPVADYCIAVRDTFVPTLGITKTIDPHIRYSDHASFWDFGFRSLCGIEIDHWDNRVIHTRGDVVDRLDMHLAGDVTRLAAASLASMARLVSAPLLIANIDLDAATLNFRSRGSYITCYIELPPDFPVPEIDVSTVTLNGSIQAEPASSSMGDYDSDGILDLMVNFERWRAAKRLSRWKMPGGAIELVVTGEVGGFPFEGRDTVSVAATEGEPWTGTKTLAASAEATYELSQNYPDPFNPTTTIRYRLPVSTYVSLKVFDVSGKLVRNLVDGYRLSGEHVAVWNGESETKGTVSSGIYFYTIETHDFTETKKMVLLK